MQFSERWLRSMVDVAWDAPRLSEALTMAGLEVDVWKRLDGSFSEVVVALVVQVEKHPDADRLNVVMVDDGEAELRQIVCGAANVRPGVHVPLARPGAVLPGLTIREAKVRGVLSRGMLCGADELGLSEDRAGLLELGADAKPGQLLIDYLHLDDAIIELGITPNRGDCLSLLGLAREVSVLAQTTLLQPESIMVAAAIDDIPEVQLEAAGCPRYLARTIRGINQGAQTPAWMRERLERSGIRLIHPVVDITNYVMLELGQPMHAFDADLIQGDLLVRQARSGESFHALNGQTWSLEPDSMVIADSRNVLAVAGIIGGRDSGVHEQTGSIILEAAHFTPAAIAGKARSLGVSTDSAHRFERGVDPCLPERAMHRASQLVLEICGGQAGPVRIAEQNALLPKAARISLRPSQVSRMLGIELEPVLIETTLSRLGMQVHKDQGNWQIEAPSWRFDLQEEVDLIEELARVYGYQNLPVRRPQSRLELGMASDQQRSLSHVLQRLVALGFQEVMTFSFQDRRLQQAVNPGLEPLALANPMSQDMAVMRTSLWPGLLATVQFNQNRQQDRLRLFESGLRFVPSLDGLRQEQRLAGVMCGPRFASGWSTDPKVVHDFYDLKGVVETLLPDGQVIKATHPALHPGQSAEVILGKEPVGLFGRLHPDLEQIFDVGGPIWLFELDMAAVLSCTRPRAKPLSRFPAVRRDFALVVDQAIAAADLLKIMRDHAGDLLVSIELFDVYQGRGLPEGHRSMAWALVWQAQDRTLSDVEVQQWSQQVLEAVSLNCGAQLRS